MKELVAFYSYTGVCKKYADELSRKNKGTLYEILELRKKPRGVIQAYTVGGFQAAAGKATKINPLGVNLSKYDTITLIAPVWVGRTPPAVNAFIDLVPAGKSVSVIMVSKSGGSNHAAIEKRIGARGCNVVSIKDVKANKRAARKK